MSELSQLEAQQLRRGQCPHCGASRFQRGPRDADSSKLLCDVCFREYDLGLVTAQIVHEICPAERLGEVYGIRLANEEGQKTEEEFP